jgi:hypothetical protein
VCLNEGVITYYQVTELLIDQNELNTNWEREVGNLESIRDSNTKIVLATNISNATLPSGIKLMNLEEWLLNK